MKRTPMVKRRPRNVVTASISLEPELLTEARARCDAQDTDFSKYIRGLVRRDLKEASAQTA